MDLVEVRPTAWMNRWTVLDFGDQLALFGFAPALRRRSSLSWVLSTSRSSSTCGLAGRRL